MQNLLLETTIIFLITLISITLLFMIFWASRFRKFTPDEYIIWLRRGKVRRSGTGVTGMQYPWIDEIIVLPTTFQLSKFEFEVNDYNEMTHILILEAVVNWRISNPEAFLATIPMKDRTNLNNNRTVTDVLISTFKDCFVNKDLNFIYRRSRSLLTELKEFSNKNTENFGFTIETIDILNVKKINT